MLIGANANFANDANLRIAGENPLYQEGWQSAAD
jgi:hypothetical protein